MPRHKIFIAAILLPIVVFLAIPAVAEVFVDTAWVRAFPGPCWVWGGVPALALDDLGNIYVIGESYVPDTTGYAIVKYLPNGDTAWLRTYHGSGNWGEIASVAVDAFGNVYVTGSDWGQGGAGFVTVKYYSSGDTSWVRTYATCGGWGDSAAAVVVDRHGNVYVTGQGCTEEGGDYTTIKYYPNGDTAWVRKYQRCDGSHFATALAVDTSGNVYVTGGLLQGDCTSAYATVKYSSDGEMIWARTYDGPEWSPYTGALDIGVDQEDNVYVTGRFESSQTQGVDYVTIKYYPTGDAWVRHYDASGGYDGASALVLDTFGNVHVTGESYTSPETGYDYTTIKYQADGDTAWINTYNGPGNGWDGARAMTSDQCDNVYVTGTSWNGTDYDFATIKYDYSGNVLWKVRYNGSGNTEDRANAIAVDGARSIYVAGCSIGNDAATVVVKYVETGMRGDVNGDWLIDVADVVRLVNFLFRQGPPPIPFDAGDANCDGYVTVGDIVYLVNYLYKGGPPPCEP